MAVPRRSIDEIDSFITDSQRSLSALPLSHPLRPVCLSGLSEAQSNRHELSNQKADLDKAILYLTEAILLQPRWWLERRPLMFQALLLLAPLLVKRSMLFKQPEDAIYAAKYLRHLRDQPHQALGFPRHRITKLLVDALVFQVVLEAGDVMQNIEELAVLWRELLTLDIPDVDTTPSITLFANTVQSKIHQGVSNQPLDQVIECLRVARKHKSDLRDTRFALTYSLGCRYMKTFVNDDYEEAASLCDEYISSSSPGDKFVTTVQAMVTMLSRARSIAHQAPEYSEEAMYRTRAILGSPSVKDYSSIVFDTAKRRSIDFGSIEGFGASSGNSPSSQQVSVVSHDDSEFGRIRKKEEILEGLVPEIRNKDITKIDEAIENGRTILAPYDPADPDASRLFDVFGDILTEAAMHTGKIEYLNESISIRRQLCKVLEPPLRRFFRRHRLAGSLLIRHHSFPGHCTKDLDEGLDMLSQCANSDVAFVRLPERFQFACRWASHARRTQHPSVSIAYETAVSLMEDTLPFAPTLQLQHATLATSDEPDFYSMPLDYASYQVDLHQLKEAIATLERGRSLLWSEMRQLRTSVDQLLEADPNLGREFAAVNRHLEDLTKSIAPSHKLSPDDGGGDDTRAVDPFGRLLVKQRGLLKERNKLVSRIQAMPGFDSFMKPPSFETLRSSASCGPVIIINHSRWRSDILILLRDSPPSLIPTSDDFYECASTLKTDLLDARNKFGLDSAGYNQTLADVLRELYNLVGKPVIDRLRQLNVPEQSRVWWCPTSVFCSLPLHAMGPIPSDDDEELYFLDLYIPSYTPTLSALIHGSGRGGPDSPTSGLPSLLLVAHFDVPSSDVSEVCKDVEVVQALNTRLPVKCLISEGATTTSVLDGLRDHQFVHFICHGTLETGKPFDAGFELYEKERLTLLDIVRSHLPAAEFAFLSACHTAELTVGSSADEGLHLAAAVQYCGFRSVVGTMWAMANQDGPDLAKHFYKSIFPRKAQGDSVPYYERSAGALRDAVKKLRKKKHITLERWVNFVHYGA